MQNFSDNNFRYFFENNEDFLFVLDMEGNIIETNNTVNQVLGYSNEELVGRNILFVHPFEFREKALMYVEKMLNGEPKTYPLPLRTKNGAYVPVETKAFLGTWNGEPALIGVSRNLSELKLSEEKFYKVFNVSPILMAISTLDTGIFININKQFLNVLGYTNKDEVIGKTSKELNLFCNYEQRKNAFHFFKENGRVENYEVDIKSKTGEIINCLFSFDKIQIQTYEYLLTSAINVSELKNAEKKINYLYNQQKLLADISQLLNSTSNLECILNNVLQLVGNHTQVSRVYIFEDTENEEITNNTFEWCNENIVPQISELQGIPYEIIPSWKPMLINEGRVFSKNITELPEDIYQILEPQGIKSILVYPLFVGGLFYGFIGFDECVKNKIWTEEEIHLLQTVSNIISNAFERRQVTKKLENSELRLKLAIKSANEGLWDWNNETGYVYFNETWCKMLGYEPHEIEPNVSSWEKLVHPEDMSTVIEVLEKHLKGETEYYETIHRVRTKQGSWKWILDHGMVTERNEKNEPLRTVGTHIDVSHQKEIEEQLKELIDTKNKLFSIIAHDLRGPIGNFLPVLELLTNGEKLDDTTKLLFLNELKNSSKLTYNLLENLLSWSRSQTNSIKLRPIQFVINDLIKENIELLSYLAKPKSIQMICTTDINIQVFADKDSINLVLRNLLSNSIKFTTEKGTISVSIHDINEFIEIEITDNGVGMSNEIAENLFKAKNFHTTRGTDGEKGAGIGLVLCKDFVERNGGKIYVKSVLNQGSQFIFTIPKW